MAEPTFNPGDEVYSLRGEAGRYVARVASGHVVEPILESSEPDEAPYYSDPVTWREVFRKPPTERLEHEVAALEAKLALRRGELNEVREQRNQFDREEGARLARIQVHEQLAELDRYLAGEITHYVAVHEYYPAVEVIPVGETIEGYANSSGYGLLTLYPSRSWDKKVHWSVTYKVPSPRYSRTETVIPCCGEEAARAKAAEWLGGYLVKYQAEDPARWSYADMLVKSCQKFGVEVPEWLLAGIAAQSRTRLERSVAEHRQKLAEAEAALAAIEASAGSKAVA